MIVKKLHNDIYKRYSSTEGMLSELKIDAKRLDTPCNKSNKQVVWSAKSSLQEQLDEDSANIRETLIKVLDEHNYCYYADTSMCLEMICEKLYYEYGIDARYRGRTIYLEDKKLATVQMVKDGYQLVGMTNYRILI